MNDALIGLLGVVVGSIVTILSQWLTNRENKRRFEQERHDQFRRERKQQLIILQDNLSKCYKESAQMLDEELFLQPDQITTEWQIKVFNIEIELQLLISSSGVSELKTMYEKMKDNKLPDQSIDVADLYKLSKDAIEHITDQIANLDNTYLTPPRPQ